MSFSRKIPGDFGSSMYAGLTHSVDNCNKCGGEPEHDDDVPGNYVCEDCGADCDQDVG